MNNSVRTKSDAVLAKLLSEDGVEVDCDEVLAKVIQDEEETALQLEGDYLYAQLEQNSEAARTSNSSRKRNYSSDEALAKALQDEWNKTSGAPITDPDTSNEDYQMAAALQEELDREVAEQLSRESKRGRRRPSNHRGRPHSPYVRRQRRNQQSDETDSPEESEVLHPDFIAQFLRHSSATDSAGELQHPFLLPFFTGFPRPVQSPGSSSGDDYEANWRLAEQLGEVKSAGMNKNEINTLPTAKFRALSTSGAALVSDEVNSQCKVCFADFVEGDNIRTLPCLHKYHIKCIDPWISKNATCPICRINVRDEVQKSH